MIEIVGLFIYTVGAIGLAYIAGHSLITKRVREWIHGPFTQEETSTGEIRHEDHPRRWPVLLVECPACFGFWTGLVSGFLLSPLVPLLPSWSVAIVLALYTAGSNLILGKALKLME